jgi:hypothetical protein
MQKSHCPIFCEEILVTDVNDLLLYVNMLLVCFMINFFVFIHYCRDFSWKCTVYFLIMVF